MNALNNKTREDWKQLLAKDPDDPADWWKKTGAGKGTVNVIVERDQKRRRELQMAAFKLLKECPDPFNIASLLAGRIASTPHNLSKLTIGKLNWPKLDLNVTDRDDEGTTSIPMRMQSFETIGKFDAIAEKIEDDNAFVRLTDEKGQVSYMACKRDDYFFRDVKEGMRFSITFMESEGSQILTCFSPQPATSPSREELVARRRRVEKAIRGTLSDY